jgi:hypothetical protein
MAVIKKKNRNVVLRLVDTNSIICTETILHPYNEKSTSSYIYYYKVCGDVLIIVIE